MGKYSVVITKMETKTGIIIKVPHSVNRYILHFFTAWLLWLPVSGEAVVTSGEASVV